MKVRVTTKLLAWQEVRTLIHEALLQPRSLRLSRFSSGELEQLSSNSPAASLLKVNVKKSLPCLFLFQRLLRYCRGNLSQALAPLHHVTRLRLPREAATCCHLLAEKKLHHSGSQRVSLDQLRDMAPGLGHQVQVRKRSGCVLFFPSSRAALGAAARTVSGTSSREASSQPSVCFREFRLFTSQLKCPTLL